MNRSYIPLLATSFILAAQSAQAHNVWLEPTPNGTLELVYGHHSELQEYDLGKVRVLRAYGSNGKEQAVKKDASGTRMVISPTNDTAMINVEYDNGFWTKIDGSTWENKSKRHFEKYLDATHSLKYNKNLLRWSDQFKQPSGMLFEVVPLENPLTRRPGDKISVQVFYQGKPLKDAGIEVQGHDENFKTDAQGKVKVPLSTKSNGLQEIAAYYRYETPNHLDANETSLTASLVFRTPQP